MTNLLQTMRPIGKRIMQVCETVEKHTTCTSSVLTPIMGTQPTNTIKYMHRAVKMGLLTVDKTTRPHSYTIVDNWRDKVNPIARVKPYMVKPRKVTVEPVRVRVNSVFELGALGG